MSADRPLRRAGRGTDGEGHTVTWSIADGRRGSRWREVRVLDASVVSSLLLELDPDGRFAHLELSTAAGLLTLHPEGDGTLHGNAIVAGGIHHVVAVPWRPDDVLLVIGSSIARAAAARRAGVSSGVVTGPDLAVERRPIDPAELAIGLDADGLPVFADGQSWPLELDG